MRRRYPSSVSSGAREAHTIVTSRCATCTRTPSKLSAQNEQDGHPSLQSGSEHEVVDEELRPAGEEAGESLLPGFRVEHVLLGDGNPLQVSPLAGQLVAEPRRQEILRLVGYDELPVGELVDRLDLSDAGVSQHLSLLRNAGCVTVRRDGKRRLYRADHEQLGPLTQFLESFWADRLDRLAALAEEPGRR